MKAYAPAATATADLLARATAGERDAFTELVERYHADLVRICYAITSDIDTARDAAQMAWIKAWQRLPSVREADKLRAWLISIAANEARQHLRAQRRRTVREIAPSGSDGADGDAAAASVDHIDLGAALMRLGAADRQLLAMRYLGGLTAEEIGAVTGSSASNVRTRLSRLVGRLRQELGND